MKEPRSVVVGVRLAPQQADALRSIAEDNASTVSRTAARLIERGLTGGPESPAAWRGDPAVSRFFSPR